MELGEGGRVGFRGGAFELGFFYEEGGAGSLVSRGGRRSARLVSVGFGFCFFRMFVVVWNFGRS